MVSGRIQLKASLALLAMLGGLLTLTGRARAQAGLEDDRVMLQGFYWESCRHGRPTQYPNFGSKHWYEIVASLADVIADGRFDLVWLPPPAYSGDLDEGYGPREYFNLENSYGTLKQQRAMLEALLRKGVEPVADLVLNHRNGSSSWVDFKNPTWGTWSICADDEAFSRVESGVKDTPMNQRGNCEEKASYMFDKTYGYNVYRDIAHTDKRVRDDVVRYLLQLRSLGYRGWRYDMVHGFHAKWIACYNAATTPTFSVGEYDWNAHNQQRGWIWNTSTQPGAQGVDHIKTSSNVFDFTTYYSLQAINGGQYSALYGFGGGIGMVGDTTDGLPWKNRAVTFTNNHDVGYRTNRDGTPEDGHKFDAFANGWQVEQAYAQILTHPGIPTVFWKHYFDWGTDLRARIKALINARKVAGVHAGSEVNLQDNARAKGVYAARVVGRKGALYVRIGGSDQDWNPSQSGYTNYREYAQGAGWKVWVALPGNPQVQQAPWRGTLPIPAYKPANQITVPDVPLCR